MEENLALFLLGGSDMFRSSQIVVDIFPDYDICVFFLYLERCLV